MIHKPDRVAILCHEVNRAYCKSIGDDSQVPWEEAPGWQKDSALNGVMFHMQHPASRPEDSHMNWMEAKKDKGWTWGAEKDANKKTHPCMVPFEALPKEQKAKDYIFHAIVRTLMDHPFMAF